MNEYSQLIGYILAAIALIGNGIQWLVNRNRVVLETQGQHLSNQLQAIENLERQLKLIQELQDTSSIAYKDAMQTKDFQINQLSAQSARQAKETIELKHQIKQLNYAVTQMLPLGCKELKCRERQSFSTPDITRIISSKNE